MAKFKQLKSRRMRALIPKSIEEYVAEDDISRYVDEVVNELDISKIEEKYSDRGRRAYPPRVMLKILIFGSMIGERSARKLEVLCKYDLRFRFLTCEEQPDFRTIARFRQEHAEELAELLAQTVRIGIAEGIISLDTITIDGTKIGAFAGRKTFKRKEELNKEYERLKKELLELVREDVEQDEAEKSLESIGVMKNIKDKKKLKDKVKKALNEANKEKLEVVSTTDPQSRYMKSKGINPAYNAQAAVDVQSEMVVGGYVTNKANDANELENVVENVEEVAQKKPKKVVADKGYGRNKKQLSKVEEKGIECYVALPKEEEGEFFNYQQFEYQPETDSYICPNGKELTFRTETSLHRIYKTKQCKGCSLRQQCIKGKEPTGNVKTLKISKYEESYLRVKDNISTEEGKQLLKLRFFTVERLFAFLKYLKNFKRFFFRGLGKVNLAWQFELAVYNILKLIKHRQIKKQPT